MASTRGAELALGGWVACARVMALAAAVLTFCAGCGEGEESAWGATQACSVGIPPFGSDVEIAPVVQPVTATVLATNDGLTLRDFTLGPIGGFSCLARQVDVDFAEAGTGLWRELAAQPFQCEGYDGRMYLLTATGAADVRAVFMTTTFSAWLPDGEALLVCTTTLRRQQLAAAPDAGLAN